MVPEIVRRNKSLSLLAIVPLLVIVLGLIVGLLLSRTVQKNTTQAQDQVPQVCENIYGLVPSVVINSSLANPEGISGWGDSANPPKIWLSIKNFEKPYNTISNPLVFKATCPFPKPIPYDGPTGTVSTEIVIDGTIPADRFFHVKACDVDPTTQDPDCSHETLVFSRAIPFGRLTSGGKVPFGKKVILVSPYIYDEQGNEIDSIAPGEISVTECDGLIKDAGCLIDIDNNFYFTSFTIKHTLEDDREFGELSGSLEIEDISGENLLDKDFQKTIEFCKGLDDTSCKPYYDPNNVFTYRDKEDNTLRYDFSFKSDPFYPYSLIFGKVYYLRVEVRPPNALSTFYYSPIQEVTATNTTIKLQLAVPKRVTSCRQIEGTGWYKVVIIPDNFTDLEEFMKFARLAANDLKQVLTIPAMDNLSFIAHEDISQDYGCAIRGRGLACNPNPVDPKSDCGATSVLFISKNDNQAGSAHYRAASVTSRSIRSTAHELGHSIAGLADEYVEAGRDPYEAPNCTLDNACPKWLPDDELGCFKGCTSEDGFRPTDTSIMRTSFDRFFNKPSLKAWTDELTQQDPLQKLLQNRAFSLEDTYHRAIKIVIENKNGKLKLLLIALADTYPQFYTAKTFGTDDYKISLRNRFNSEIYSGVVPYKMRQLHVTDSGDTALPDALVNPIVLFLPYSSTATNVVISDEKGKQKLNIKIPTSSKQAIQNKKSNLCGNGLCDGMIGENASSCSSDCSTPQLRAGPPQ